MGILNKLLVTSDQPVSCQNSDLVMEAIQDPPVQQRQMIKHGFVFKFQVQ